MSSRCSIVYTSNGTHLYEETNQPQGSVYNFLGFDVVWSAFWREYESVKIDNGTVVINMRPNTELTQKIGRSTVWIFGEDITETEFDDEGFSLTIKGGSKSARDLCSGKHVKEIVSRETLAQSGTE